MRPLIRGALTGNAQLIRDTRTGIDVPCFSGLTALMIASAKGHTECIRALLAAGANPNARDREGGTALMSACGYGSPEVVRLLLRSGADVNAVDEDGWSAAFFCAERDRADTLRELPRTAIAPQKLPSGEALSGFFARKGARQCAAALNAG